MVRSLNKRIASQHDISIKEKHNILIFVLILFIIGFQVSINFDHEKSKFLQFSDCLLPFLFLGLFKKDFSFSVKSLRWPFWLLFFSFWFGLTTFLGCKDLGCYTPMLFVEKFSAWLILLLYFCLGNYFENSRKTLIDSILKILFITSGLMSLIYISLYWINNLDMSSLMLFHNKHTINFKLEFLKIKEYGLFLAFVTILQTPFLLQRKLLSLFFHWILILSNLMVIVIAEFRPAILSLSVAVISFIITNAIKRKPLCIAFLVAICIFGFIDFHKYNKIYYTKITQYFTAEYASQEQQAAMIKAIHWWQKKPLMGIGAGNFGIKQQQQNSNPVTKINNTPVLLLTEIGFIGFILYAWFLFNGRRVVSQKSKENKEDLLVQGMVMIFPAFMVASLFTEIFYQRYLWFFLGLALAKQKNIPSFSGEFWSSLRKKYYL